MAKADRLAQGILLLLPVALLALAALLLGFGDPDVEPNLPDSAVGGRGAEEYTTDSGDAAGPVRRAPATGPVVPVPERGAASRGEGKSTASAVTGTVLDPDGSPAPDVRVVARRLGDGRGDGIAETRSASDGAFRLEPVPAEPLGIEVTSPDHAPLWQTGVTAGAHLLLRLSPGGRLRIRVVDPEGTPAPRVTVSYLQREISRTSTTTGDGLAEFHNLPLGAASILAFDDSGRVGRARAVVSHGETVEVVVRIHEGVRLRGRAIDGATGAPVAEAEIRIRYPLQNDLEGPEAITDARGVFEIHPVSVGAGHVDVWAAHPSYAGARLLLVGLTAAKADEEIELVLVPQREVSGWVEDLAGEPVAGARVWWRGAAPSSSDLDPVRSDRHGVFLLPLPDGVDDSALFGLVAFAPGRGLGVGAVQGRDLGGEPIRVTLREFGTVRGRVHDGKGAGRPGTLVTLHLDRAGMAKDLGGSENAGAFESAWNDGLARLPPRYAATDGEGRFVIASVPPGSWQIRAEEAGTAVALPEPCRVVAHGETHVEIALPRGAMIAGWVLAPDGELPTGASVSAFPVDETGLGLGPHWAVCRSDGRFEIPDVPGEGCWRLVATASGFGRSEYACARAGDVGIEILLGRAAGLQGTVRKGGRPWDQKFQVTLLPGSRTRSAGDGAPPLIRSPPRVIARAVSRHPEGAWVLEKLEAGDYAVLAETVPAGHAAFPRSVRVQAGESVQVPAMELAPVGGIEGTVRSPGGIPVRNTVVGVRPVLADGSRLDPTEVTRTGSAGTFVFPALAPGLYQIVTSPPLSTSPAPTVTVHSTDRVHIELQVGSTD